MAIKRFLSHPKIVQCRRMAIPFLRLTWKSLRYTLHRLWILARWTLRTWWRLPPLLKWGKFAVVILLIIGMFSYGNIRNWMHYRDVYSNYYAHFHEEYIKTQSPYLADYYADYYAEFYAKYYSSASYREMLKYALPSATSETVAFPLNSPIAKREINSAGLELIKSFEGLRLEPYEDAGGKLTIGYGHLIKPGEYFTAITEEEAHALLREDVRVAEAYVKRYVHVKLNHNQFSALVSLVYNIGPGNFRNSTMLTLLNMGKGDRAASEFPRWNKVGTTTLRGLTRRRLAEQSLFES